MGFPVTVNSNGASVIEILPDSTVAIVEHSMVTLNRKNPLNDNPIDYDSVYLTKEQIYVLADQLREMDGRGMKFK